MSLRVNNISKSYGKQNVLNDVSFELNDDEIVGFLGPNGAGKSTTMKIITGFLSADAGTVCFDGVDIQKDPIAAKRLIGYLPEHNPLYLDMYVREYLDFAAGFYSLGKNKNLRINRIIEQVGIGDACRKKIGQLSKGYRQRVGLAQALVHDPKILILDEPTTGLDPNQLTEIRTLITQLGKEKTVLLSTHILQEVKAVCSRVLILNHGSLVGDRKIHEYKNEVANYCLEVKTNDSFEGNWNEVCKDIVDVRVGETGCYILVSTRDIRSEVLKYIVENNISLLSIRECEQEVDVESLFRGLTSN